MDAGIAPRLDEHGFPVKEANPNVHDIYNREAKIYDSAMVERWKTAMEGLLIFAGLFSAAVTAFIIEGYKSLKPDADNLTVALLYQLSQQMAIAANGTQFPSSALLPPPSEASFSPARTAVAANILWFTSLGLSLACAVAATLVQQWARNYIHAVERRPSAERRARMRMYLFEGIERFNMTQIVDGVPALLHLSLFSFLLGLVFFIQTINWLVTAVAIAIFTISVGSYLYATFLPFVAFNSPIQTPLTSIVWHQSVISGVYWICPRVSIVASTAINMSIQVWRQCRRCFRPIKNSSAAMWTAVDLVIRRGSSTSSLPLWTLPVKITPRKSWLELKEQWSYDGFTSLDSVRSSAARDTTTQAFMEREKQAFTWLVECLDEDREILPFIEAMPTFVNQAAEDHDAEATFSHVFCRPQLCTRLPALLRRHEDNVRIQAAFANFLVYADENAWKHVLPLEHDMYYIPPELITPLSVPTHIHIWAQMHRIQSTINFCRISTGRPWLTYIDETLLNSLWPVEFQSAWRQMIQTLSSIFSDIPFSIRLTLFFTKALLNVSLDDNDQTTPIFMSRILKDYLPLSMSWFSDSSTPEEQQSYCAILATIVSAIEARYDKFPLSYILNAVEAFVVQSHRMSDSASLRAFDKVLHSKIWALDSYTAFQPIVEAHINKLDETGCPVLSQDVITKYHTASLRQASSLVNMVTLLKSLNLQHTTPDVQWQFVAACDWLSYVSFDSFRHSDIDPETGTDESVLFMESVIDVIYTIDALAALESALNLVSLFLEPECYPYNECALQCHKYLQNMIHRRVLLDSMYDHTMTVVGQATETALLPPDN